MYIRFIKSIFKINDMNNVVNTNYPGLISVIVPVYKVEPYLTRCVHSIIDQTYTNLEIILVDDGSPDNCSTMCDDWEKLDNRIIVIHKQNGGLSDARNVGLKTATGEFISFVDSDDWIAPDMMKYLLNAIQEDKSDIAACTVEMIWDDGTPSEFLTVHTNCVLNRTEAQKALLEEKLLKQPVWYKLYKRETIEGILFEVGKQHEDVFWSYQAIGRAERVSIIDYIGYYYFQRSDSIMGNGYSLKNLDAMEAYEKRYAFIKENFPELEREARVGIISACIYNGQMALKYLPKDEQKHAMKDLKQMKKKHIIKHSDYARDKLSHRFWLDVSQISFYSACKLKNLLKVGF